MKDVHPLARYLVALRRWWWVVAASVLVGAALAVLTLPESAGEPTSAQLADSDSTFRATQILVRGVESDMAPSLDIVTLLARQDVLTNRVVESMDGQVSASDVEEIELETDPEIRTLAITVLQPDPARAELLARTFATELKELLAERVTSDLGEDLAIAEERVEELRAEVTELQDQLAGLAEGDPDRRLTEAKVEGLLNQYSVVQQELQELETQQLDVDIMFETLQEPTAVNTQLDEEALLSLPQATLPRISLALLVALLIGVGVVAAIEHLDTRIRRRRDVEEAFGLPVVADLPVRSRRQIRDHPLPVTSERAGITAEAVRALRLFVTLAPTWRLSRHNPTDDDSIGSVAAVREHEPPRSLLVTSSITGEGKSTIVANLAASFAESGHRVLVVDCDFRRAEVGDLLGAQPAPGLRSLQHPFERSLKELVVPTATENVELLPAGRPGFAPRWFVAHSSAVVQQAVEMADVAIFDTGPILSTNEATALIPSIDATILVNRANKVTFGQARSTVEQLARVSANMVGIAMIGSDRPRRNGHDETPGPGERGDSTTARGRLGRTTQLPNGSRELAEAATRRDEVMYR